MTREWEAGVRYNAGDRVCYNGTDYNVIQGHTSQNDWSPPVVPALYGSAGPSHGHGGGGGYQQPQQYQQQPQAQQQPFGGQQAQSGTPAAPPPTKYSEGHGFDDGGSDKSDADDDEFDKKKLAMGIGGGLGLAALVGGGIYAYTRHKSKKAEEAKKEAWSENANQQTWQAGAEKRTRELATVSDKKKPPVFWVLTDRPGDVPRDAIPIGREAGGEPLFAARAFYQGGLHVGKVGKHFNPPGAVISWGGGAVTVEKYEVLVGDPRAISWKKFDERPHVRGWQPIDAGRESDGTFLFLAKTDNYGGGVQVGKVREDEDAVCFGYGDAEVKSKPFYIAAYA